MSYKVTFIERLTEAMKIRGVNKITLCEMAGINKSTMSRYFSGEILPKVETIDTLSKVLNVSPVWLMGYNSKMERETKKSQQDYETIKKLVWELTENEREQLLNMIFIMFPRLKDSS